MKLKLLSILICSAILALACASRPSIVPDAQPTSPADYSVREFVEPPAGAIPARRFRLYEPNPRTSEPLPLVVIAPAGNRFLHGIAPDAVTDAPEHLPWVRAGFVVVTFSIDGELSDEDFELGTPEVIGTALDQFRQARAGVDNARAALDLALDRSLIDTSHILAVGHSSAASLALLFASQDSRVKAVAAFAPCTDIEKRLSDLLTELRLDFPEHVAFLEWSSPKNHSAEIEVPVFLFHARDDSSVSFAESAEFVDILRATGNSSVSLVVAEKGDHYSSMIDLGIPQAIEWARNRGARQGSAQPTGNQR